MFRSYDWADLNYFSMWVYFGKKKRRNKENISPHTRKENIAIPCMEVTATGQKEEEQ
jgi:hypothetical protein